MCCVDDIFIVRSNHDKLGNSYKLSHRITGKHWIRNFLKTRWGTLSQNADAADTFEGGGLEKGAGV